MQRIPTICRRASQICGTQSNGFWVFHASVREKPISDGKTLHRIDEAVVLSEFKQAGFVLEAEGQFLRNPADTRDFSSGDGRVLTDKFALRFVKPN